MFLFSTNKSTGGFGSIDPAVFEDKDHKMDTDIVDRLIEQLVNESLPLYERYVSMFRLRNINTNAAILGLCKGQVYIYQSSKCIEAKMQIVSKAREI